jgi:chorismate synthase
VGFNPFRQQRHSRVDVAIVILAVVVTAAVVAWALLGG